MQNPSSIGIIIKDFHPSQLIYYSVKYANLLVNQGGEYDITFFYEQLSPISIKPSCAIMNISEIWSFTGTLIATNLESALLLTKVISSANKIFYVWDLEWLRQYKNYLYNIQVYLSNELKLVARSIDHAKAINKYCNRNVNAVIPNCQLVEFLNV